MSTIEQRHALGVAIARLYIAAQEGVSMEASDAACNLMENASIITKLGFNQEMAKSPYLVQAPHNLYLPVAT